MHNLTDKSATIQNKGPFTVKVLENVQISPDIYRLKLESKEVAKNAMPGQFVSIKCKDLTLRRPFSVARVYEEGSFDLLYKVIGEGTEYLTSLKAGDEADFFGAMGNAFNIEDKTSLLIGCGVGIAPIMFLSDKFNEKNIQHTTIIGSKTAVELDIFGDLRIITEDGTLGLKGRLDSHLENIIQETSPEKIYICGPNPAMKYVVSMAEKYNLEIEVALEKVFACGTGVCGGCAIQIMENGERVNRRICSDGPVFNGRQIIWE